MVAPCILLRRSTLAGLLLGLSSLSLCAFAFTSSSSPSPTSVNLYRCKKQTDAPVPNHVRIPHKFQSSVKPSQEDSESPSIDSPVRRQSSTPLENLNLVAGNQSNNQRLRQQWKQQIPNYLTYLRLVMIPAVVFSFTASSLSWKRLAPIWFAVATISDGLDGYLARKWKVTSDFGAFLDPVADKLLVTTTLILLTAAAPIVAAPTIIIVAREVAVSALREWMAQRQLRDTVQVSWQGKLKTASTMVALLGMLSVAPQVLTSSSSSATIPSSTSTSGRFLFGGNTLVGLTETISVASTVSSVTRSIWRASLGLLYTSAVLTMTSGATYFRAAAAALLGNEKPE